MSLVWNWYCVLNFFFSWFSLPLALRLCYRCYIFLCCHSCTHASGLSCQRVHVLMFHLFSSSNWNKQTNIQSQAHRNFHFYWRHIKCFIFYYIMVHTSNMLFPHSSRLFHMLHSTHISIIVFASCDYLEIIQFFVFFTNGACNWESWSQRIKNQTPTITNNTNTGI